MLTELGFRVHEAVSPEAALAAVDAGLEPDIMITDHIMPGMTGVELAYALQARRPNVRTLIISGYAEVETLDPTLPRLSKPFKQNDLASALAALAPPPRSSRGKADAGVRGLQAPLAAPLECSVSEPLI
jgi:YesN/AraC family two-component response regulator